MADLQLSTLASDATTYCSWPHPIRTPKADFQAVSFSLGFRGPLCMDCIVAIREPVL